MNLKNKLALAIVLAVMSSVTIIYAAIVVQRNVDSRLIIVPVNDMEILDVDKTTTLIFIDFGTLNRGQAVAVPEGGNRYWVHNIGDGEIWISYTLTDWPANVDLKIWICLEGGSYETILPGDITTFSIPADAYAEFYCYALVGNAAAFGTYNPVFTFNAHDTSVG